jgi:hypothetical protein
MEEASKSSDNTTFKIGSVLAACKQLPIDEAEDEVLSPGAR